PAWPGPAGSRWRTPRSTVAPPSLQAPSARPPSPPPAAPPRLRSPVAAARPPPAARARARGGADPASRCWSFPESNTDDRKRLQISRTVSLGPPQRSRHLRRWHRGCTKGPVMEDTMFTFLMHPLLLGPLALLALTIFFVAAGGV